VQDRAHITNRIDLIAADIGRLRRRQDAGSCHVLDRLVVNVQALAGMFEPTAGELANTAAPGDDQAITEAIRIVDDRARKLDRLLAA
jgi:hypothetical protein